jgi:hypothetical protein
MTVMNLYSMLCISQEITIQMKKKQHRAEAVVGQLMDSVRLKDAVRFRGVTAFHLRRRAPATPLFDGFDRTQKLHKAVDRINNLF